MESGYAYDAGMPRISEAARAARRAQILDAARATFTERGFRQTSMHDILRAAGVSAGGAYRYFASKDEIIAAVAGEAVSALTDVIEQLGSAQPPLDLDEAMRRLLAFAEHVSDGPGRLALMVWGEAQSDPAIHALAQAEAGRIRAAVIEMVAGTRRRDALAPGTHQPDAPAALSDEALGTVLFSLVAGYLMQRRVIGQVDADRYVATIGALLMRAPETWERQTGGAPD